MMTSKLSKEALREYLIDGVSQAEIGRVSGLSRERVRQLIGKYELRDICAEHKRASKSICECGGHKGAEAKYCMTCYKEKNRSIFICDECGCEFEDTVGRRSKILNKNNNPRMWNFCSQTCRIKALPRMVTYAKRGCRKRKPTLGRNKLRVPTPFARSITQHYGI